MVSACFVFVFGTQDIQDPLQIATEASGFVTIVAGTFLLHTTRDMDVSFSDLVRGARRLTAAWCLLAPYGILDSGATIGWLAVGAVTLLILDLSLFARFSSEQAH